MFSVIMIAVMFMIVPMVNAGMTFRRKMDGRVLRQRDIRAQQQQDHKTRHVHLPDHKRQQSSQRNRNQGYSFKNLYSYASLNIYGKINLL